VDVDEYLEKTPSFLLHHFPWELTAGNFRTILERFFVHIGCSENLQKTVDILAGKLGKERVMADRENISPRDETASAPAVRSWKAKHALEYDIYGFARDLNGLDGKETGP
jgi:hypothetical protein